MDDVHSDNDVSLSPSQILERLQVLRQLQLMQRGKLQKQRLQCKESSESSSSFTEIVSHFSNSTSYNTFRSLLQSSSDISVEGTSRLNTNDSQKVQERDLIEGVSVLNLSQESEFIVSSPLSSRSRASVASKGLESSREYEKIPVRDSSPKGTPRKSTISPVIGKSSNGISKKQISLEDMPILSPKKDFESLLVEKLQTENSVSKSTISTVKSTLPERSKKPFLKRGEGIARFGLKNNALVIQSTKSLPWKRKSVQNKSFESPLKQNIKELRHKLQHNPSDLIDQLLVPEVKVDTLTRKHKEKQNINKTEKVSCQESSQSNICEKLQTVSNSENKSNENGPTTSKIQPLKAVQKIEFSKNTHPQLNKNGKTWAAVLTKEQNDFLMQLKQSDYYKNFSSPTKSEVSDASCNDTMMRLRQERESAEQHMFELLENKVNNESFNLENSFFNRFLRRNNLEYSGESTPLVMHKCLSENPNLMHVLSGLTAKKRNENSHSDAETCCSTCTDSCSDAGSSVSCCSCKTVERTTNSTLNFTEGPERKKKVSEFKNNKRQVNQKEVDNKTDANVTMKETDVMKAEMAEMNAKLIATSELLKERLSELEDEIETFRKENANLAKLREEIDLDRQKFYEEKSAFEQKLNEEKVLSEYYLAEEKEKLLKQKQMYDRYVKEMRGRLNKKDKDEVINLKKEINDLKEEIRIKDAKSTSTIARLRNQIKIMEKEKKDLQDEVEKLKKLNKRIQHSNEVTRRLTNIKYLEEINKKLNNMASKDTRSEVNVDPNIKYKAYEIERQSRIRKVEPVTRETIRPLKRAKSVPNLNVTSRYAKYFSQRDTASQINQNKLLDIENYLESDDDKLDVDDEIASHDSNKEDTATNDEDNYLEKMYLERFKSNSPKSNRSSCSSSNYDHILTDKPQLSDNMKDFFIPKPKSNSLRKSKSPRTKSPSYNSSQNQSKSPVSITMSKSPNFESNSNNTYDWNQSQKNSKSPNSTFNHSSLRSATVIHNSQYGNAQMAVSPEPIVSRTSLTKTTMNPTEYKKSDGSTELRFPNGNVKYISADGKHSKFMYYNGDVKENFYNEGRIKYFYAETKTYHTTHADGLEVLEFPDGQVEKRYKDGSSEIRLPNGSIRYFDPKNEHVREEWRFPDGAALTVSANGERRIVFSNGQIEVHAKDHKRREFPDGTVKLVYNDGTSETRYASGRVRIKDKHGSLIMDSAPG
ncbi:unnamed protein product [Arctia plantaginis]|uniref:Centromere protein J n=1 Tax=Arctia plantaginis TaxID=874455 RepID=A0A8S1ANB7_ARCPL|nr:unnamed protein product [Arctia plantaginis]